MLVYTVQPKEIIDQIDNLKPNESLLVDNSKINFKDENNFIIAYKYMRFEMNKKLNTNYASYPWWAFIDKPTIHEIKKGFTSCKTPYLITLDIPDEKLVLSDFQEWHSPLMNVCCFKTEEEMNEKWDELEKLKTTDIFKYFEIMTDSWQQIFDISNTPARDIQATFFEIQKKKIVSIKKCY